MATETKNIIQLKETTSGPTFYPETHKAAIVGKETYSYLGETVSPGGGGGGSTGGDKPLSVSPRQSVIVGKAIPFHPRKGKKYYFADGIIKVKTGKDLSEQDNGGKHSLISYYAPNDLVNALDEDVPPTSHCVPNSVYGGWAFEHPVLVTIMEESPGNTTFNLATMVKISFPEHFTTQTESPFFEIRDNLTILTEVKIPTDINFTVDDNRELANRITNGHYMADYSATNHVRSSFVTFSGNIIAYCFQTRYPEIKFKNGSDSVRREYPTREMRYKKWTADKLRDWWKAGQLRHGVAYVHSVRRNRIGKNACKVIATEHVVTYVYKSGGSSGKKIAKRYTFFRRYKSKE